MPTNPQDFPTSLFEFSSMFSTEEACLAYLYEELYCAGTKSGWVHPNPETKEK